jgi:cob(I)alamin adenosyltransferase
MPSREQMIETVAAVLYDQDGGPNWDRAAPNVAIHFRGIAAAVIDALAASPDDTLGYILQGMSPEAAGAHVARALPNRR